jgi:hypothetical protein
MGKDSDKSQTSTQTSAPWSGVQPYLTDLLKRGKNVTNQPFNFYNGDTVAPFSPEQELGFNLTTQRALAGSPTLNAANQNLTSTLNGDYMSPGANPWLKGTVDQAMNDVQGRINSQFSNSNFGSSAHQETLQRGLGQVANDIYGGNYQAERGRQVGSLGMAPGLASADYLDMQALQDVGQQRQNLANQYLGLAGNTFGQAAQFPYDQLQRYQSVVGSGSGQGGTTTSTAPNPNQSNGFANLLGAGLTLGGLFSGGGFGFSDVRLKSNIERVGTHPIGVGIYDYDKFGKRERGVMAQEVEQVLPEAVATHPSGYKVVNYGLLN